MRSSTMVNKKEKKRKLLKGKKMKILASQCPFHHLQFFRVVSHSSEIEFQQN